jgi:peptidoglycan hydrolase CwlO-like protein
MSNQCESIRYRIIDFTNDLMTAQSRIFSAREKVQKFEQQVSDLESKILIAELQAVASRGAVRALGLGGAAVTALSSIEAEIRVSRLNDELNRAEANLTQATTNFEDAEGKVRQFEGDIRTAEADFARTGCD